MSDHLVTFSVEGSSGELEIDVVSLSVVYGCGHSFNQLTLCIPHLHVPGI